MTPWASVGIDIPGMSEHYVCTGGCGGVSENPGTCQAANCPKHEMPLEFCDCKDGKHYGRQEKEDHGEEKLKNN